jgi:hypothetical protein
MYINTVNRLATTQGHKLFLWLLETIQEGITHKINHEKIMKKTHLTIDIHILITIVHSH